MEKCLLGERRGEVSQDRALSRDSASGHYTTGRRSYGMKSVLRRNIRHGTS